MIHACRHVCTICHRGNLQTAIPVANSATVTSLNIKFCGKFELALRGRDESKDSDNPWIYRGLIDLMAELDKVLADHLKTATVYKRTLKTIQNELLDCMYEVYLDKVKAEINTANFVSIQADETTDVACKWQLVIILRYLVNGEIKERFLGFHEAKEKSAKAITQIIKDQIEGYNLTENWFPKHIMAPQQWRVAMEESKSWWERPTPCSFCALLCTSAESDYASSLYESSCIHQGIFR